MNVSRLALLLCMAVLNAYPQSSLHPVHGSVFDAATHDPLPAAIIRVQGTAKGTVTNAAGRFSLQLGTESAVLYVSCLGYATDTMAVSAGRNDLGAIALAPEAIIMPEVIVTSEDPAIAIIRQAIARKHQWIDRLATYSMDAFTRQVLRSDTAIASMSESITHGYWRMGDTLREVVAQKRQTQNIKKELSVASVGRILNFNEDRIRFVGYEFVGPTAEDALDFYDYKLLRTRTSHGRSTYDIAVIPRSQLRPLFKGTVTITGDSYALAGIDVEPNEAFSLPFITDLSLRYRQQFILCDSTFWMPADIRINGRFVVGIPAITLPAIAMEQTSVISSYAINVPLPDSIFGKPRLVEDSSAARYDSVAWSSQQVLPLTPEEHTAYVQLDSTKTLDVIFKPNGLAGTLAVNDGGASSVLSLLDLSFNRVEGAHLGASYTLDSISPYLQLTGGYAYAFSAKKSSWLAGATAFLDRAHVFGIGGRAETHYDVTPGWQSYNTFFNSLSTLFAKTDVFDFHRAEGWKTFVLYSPSHVVQMKLGYNHEWHSPAPKTTDFSILFPSRPFRTNPEAWTGRLRSLRWDFRLGREVMPIDLVSYDGVGVMVEHADAAMGSDFTFTQYNTYASFSFPTFGREFFLKPQVRIRASAGTSTGTLPPQRIFSVETGAAGTSPFGAMKAMGVKEFRGTSYVALSVEHNFRNLPFLALGIPRKYRFDVEFLVHGGMANSWGATDFPAHPEGWYYEAGCGLSRLLGLFRGDITWRLSAPRGVVLTVGFANLF